MEFELSRRALFLGWLTYVALFLAPIFIGPQWIEWRIYYYVDFEHFPIVLRVFHYSAPFLAGLVTILVSRAKPGSHAVVLAALCVVSLGTWDLAFRAVNEFPSPSLRAMLWWAIPIPLVALGTLSGHTWVRRAA